jgi:hypothetical protein
MLLNRFLIVLSILFVLSPLTSRAGAPPPGNLCLYISGAGEVVCSLYSNSSVNDELDCAAEARASNPACGLTLTGVNTSCASQIFGSVARCLDDAPPHNITGSTTQAACEAAGDRWCPSTYYFFFNGNNDCALQICADAQDVLPIELIKFQGSRDGMDNHITWSTGSESNNNYFILEHSLDGAHWNPLGQIAGAGNSTEIMGYRFIHSAVDQIVNYYRLFQVDYDGTSKVYAPISIDNRDQKFDGLFSDFYPNPSDQNMYFQYGGSDFLNPVVVEVLNAVGERIMLYEVSEFNRYQGIPLDASTLPSGLYTARIRQGDEFETKKIVIAH